MARILDNDLLGDEEYVERTLRPQYFKEYIGQDKVKDQLKIFIEAAKLRDEALDHRMPMAVEEVLYSAMEDYYIDIMIGAGETSRSVHLELPPFTLVGATTRAGMLSNPLRARFGINGHMEYYELPDLKELQKSLT